MRPIILKGHTRPITQVKFNREGDLLFTCSKATNVCVWRTDTGQRLGTYEAQYNDGKGHTGAIWSVDVNYETSLMLSGAADNSAWLWDVKTGEALFCYPHLCPVRDVNFAHCEQTFFTVTDQVMGRAPTIRVYKLGQGSNQSEEPELTIQGPHERKKITRGVWGPLNQTILTTHEDGCIYVYDPRSGKMIKQVYAHEKSVTDIEMAPDFSSYVTSSTDGDAKLWDLSTHKLIKTFSTGRPVNSASISPIHHHVITGGGQSASSVTTTRVDNTQFHCKIFHKVFGEELARVPGHFDPVNTVAYSPDGLSFASGGEDGYVRLNYFDSNFRDIDNQLESELNEIEKKDKAAGTQGDGENDNKDKNNKKK